MQAKARRLELTSGHARLMRVGGRDRQAATVAVACHGRVHKVAENALIGIDNSSSNARSAAGSRPRVVR